MADDWIGINSAHILAGGVGTSHCGEETDLELALGLDGDGEWAHYANEVHWFILDLGESYTIKKVRGRSDEEGSNPIDVDIYVSDDKEDWGTAVATGISTWQDTQTWQEVDTVDKVGRYIKVVINDTESAIKILYWGREGPPPYMAIFDAYGSVAAVGLENKSANMAAKMIAGGFI